MQAADGFALDAGPNVGSSQRYVLDVVTPEQLRSMLEARELMLRRRFETIVEELTDTRNLLSALTTEPKAAHDRSGQRAAASRSRRAASRAMRPADEASRQAVAPQAVQVERVLQNSQRSAHETLQVALGFR